MGNLLVTACGRLCLHRKRINISTVLAGQDSASRKSTMAFGSSASCTTILDISTWSRAATSRQPVRPEVVTHVLGTICHPCVRAGHEGYWRWMQPGSNRSPPSNSLLTGKRTGNSAEFGLPMRFRRPIGERIQWLGAKFPTQRNREFPHTYQGKSFKEQGIFHPKCLDFEF